MSGQIDAQYAANVKRGAKFIMGLGKNRTNSTTSTNRNVGSYLSQPATLDEVNAKLKEKSGFFERVKRFFSDDASKEYKDLQVQQEKLYRQKIIEEIQHKHKFSDEEQNW